MLYSVELHKTVYLFKNAQTLFRFWIIIAQEIKCVVTILQYLLPSHLSKCN